MEVCTRDEPHEALVGWAAERLTAEQQSAIAAMAISDFIESRDQARALAGDYLAALARRRRGREVESLRRSARASSDSREGDDQAAAAAQAVISLRRESETGR
jgi:hypothetical protein